MAANSAIEWTEATWNPVTGCTKISSGCKNCYAERMTRRLQAMGQPNYASGFNVKTHRKVLAIPLKLWANQITPPDLMLKPIEKF
jgi:protein gp37